MEFEKLQVIFWSLAESMFTFASPEIRLLVSNNTMDKSMHKAKLRYTSCVCCCYVFFI